MFGHQLLLPVPDIDRTDFFLVLGANPLASNGSLMTAPGSARRLRAIRARGGRMVVVDPRRTETARAWPTSITSSGRAATRCCLLALLQRAVRRGPRRLAPRWTPMIDGLEELEAAARAFTPERVAARPASIPRRSRASSRATFAAAPRAVVYGRVGVSTQEFGGLATWLINALNIVTGNFDRDGGAMFTRPAVDLVALGGARRPAAELRPLADPRARAARVRRRAAGAMLAEEIVTPGAGHIRA